MIGAAKHTPRGDWRKPVWTVAVMPSVPDARRFIDIHADSDWEAVDAAERLGYRAYGAKVAGDQRFNPYTGEPRDARDIQTDPQGILIRPPGAVMFAAKATGSPA